MRPKLAELLGLENPHDETAGADSYEWARWDTWNKAFEDAWERMENNQVRDGEESRLSIWASDCGIIRYLARERLPGYWVWLPETAPGARVLADRVPGRASEAEMAAFDRTCAQLAAIEGFTKMWGD